MSLNISDDQVNDIMRICQTEASHAILSGNPPFACIIVNQDGQPLVQIHNTQNTNNDPTAHAEINALRELGKKLQTTCFADYVVFANAESCVMCLFACIKAHIREFYFGAAAEHRVDNWISVQEIARHISPRLIIHSDILGEACTAQIAQARHSIPFRNN